MDNLQTNLARIGDTAGKNVQITGTAVECRDGNVDGSRVVGLGSFRLLLGTFENEEFGNYTRYTYYNPEACVVLKVNGKTLVLSGRDATETQSIYQQLLDKTQ